LHDYKCHQSTALQRPCLAPQALPEHTPAKASDWDAQLDRRWPARHRPTTHHPPRQSSISNDHLPVLEKNRVASQRVIAMRIRNQTV
ncbi:hypothetical protein WAJ61_21625, partial [Acinetobacter baumannii]